MGQAGSWQQTAGGGGGGGAAWPFSQPVVRCVKRTTGERGADSLLLLVWVVIHVLREGFRGGGGVEGVHG